MADMLQPMAANAALIAGGGGGQRRQEPWYELG